MVQSERVVIGADPHKRSVTIEWWAASAMTSRCDCSPTGRTL